MNRNRTLLFAALISAAFILSGCSHYVVKIIKDKSTIWYTGDFDENALRSQSLPYKIYAKVGLPATPAPQLKDLPDGFSVRVSQDQKTVILTADAAGLLACNTLDFNKAIDNLRENLDVLKVGGPDAQRVINKVFEHFPQCTEETVYLYGFYSDGTSERCLIMPGMRMTVAHSAFNTQDNSFRHHFESSNTEYLYPYDYNNFIKFTGEIKDAPLIAQDLTPDNLKNYYFVNGASDFDAIHNAQETNTWKYYSLNYDFGHFYNFINSLNPSVGFNTKAMILRGDSFSSVSPNTGATLDTSQAKATIPYRLAFAGNAWVTMDIPVTVNKQHQYFAIGTPLSAAIHRSEYPEDYILHHLKVYRKYNTKYKRVYFEKVDDILNLPLLSNDKICLK